MISKILSRTKRAFIKLLVYFNVDSYMSQYTKWLKKNGMIIKGTPKFISPDVYFDGADYSAISIGDNVTISREVMLLTHDYSITTAMASIGKPIARHEGEYYFLNPISIGDNCFIGARASILPGTTIGNNCIIGACAVVKGDVPENTIIAGNPARIIEKTSEYANKHLQKKDFLVEK